MAAYADYEYYANTYRGAAIAQADFPRLALRASERIDELTFGRTAPVVAANTDTSTINAVKMACCAVAEELAALQASGGPVTSERVGNYSVTYAVSKSTGARLADAARRYLWDTELMYRGLDAD